MKNDNVGRIAVFSFLASFLLWCVIALWCEVFYTEDTRPMEWQMIEARANARIGRLTHLNREAVKNLEPGDIVLLNKNLWITVVNCVDARGAVLVKSLPPVVDLSQCYRWLFLDDKDMSPNYLRNIFKLGTEKWYQAAVAFTLQGIVGNWDKPVKVKGSLPPM